MTLLKFYRTLLDTYGPQGWWPVSTATTESEGGYHCGNYDYPRTSTERYEIVLGTLLTQNTNWNNASESLKKLIKTSGLNPEKIIQLPEEELASLIRSSGYYNQKAKRIQEITSIFLSGGYLDLSAEPPSRDFLLQCRGIGPETADSILLYAFRVKSFVIDLYTRRILARRGYRPEKDDYSHWRDLAVKELPSDLQIYQEFHALILAHGKNFCSAKPKCDLCLLKKGCPGAAL